MPVRITVCRLQEVAAESVIFNIRLEINWHADNLLVPAALSACRKQAVAVSRVCPLLIHYPYGPGSSKYRNEPEVSTLVMVSNLMVIVCGIRIQLVLTLVLVILISDMALPPAAVSVISLSSATPLLQSPSLSNETVMALGEVSVDLGICILQISMQMVVDADTAKLFQITSCLSCVNQQYVNMAAVSTMAAAVRRQHSTQPSLSNLEFNLKWKSKYMREDQVSACVDVILKL